MTNCDRIGAGDHVISARDARGYVAGSVTLPWVSVRDSLPTPGVLVEALTPGGDVRPLKYSDNLWWLPDGSMYVYFTPTHWREVRR